MISLEVPLTLETFKDYVIPGIVEKQIDHEALISALKDCGMSVPAIINSCIAYHLERGDVVIAADLCECLGVPFFVGWGGFVCCCSFFVYLFVYWSC